MKMSVSPHAARRVPLARAADSSERTLVLPTATTRPPRSRAAATAATAASLDLVPLAVHPVFLDALAAHRLEGAGADVQRHAGP